LRAVYSAPTAEAAQQQLERFGEKWDKKYGAIRMLWERHWQRIIPFFAFTPEIRKVMYTTNAIESLNMSLRKIIKTRGSFPSEQAALKLLYMALKNVVAKWQRNVVDGWHGALNQFTLLWSDRIQAVARNDNRTGS
jgi:putative transposase